MFSLYNIFLKVEYFFFFKFYVCVGVNLKNIWEISFSFIKFIGCICVF